MPEERLSERKKLILKAIIDAHISYGEPVGSKYLAQNQQLSCSSATIRNEMAELEALGFLEQPHTSAGRIPSDRGYEFYVNSLLNSYRMTTAEIEQIHRTLERKLSELDQILTEASRLASRFTNYTGIAVKPRTPAATVTHFKGMYVNSRNFVLVMLLSSGNVKTKSVHVSYPFTQEDLTLLVQELNELLVGRTADRITLSLLMELEQRMQGQEFLVSPVAKVIYEVLAEQDGGDLRVEGVNRLLQYPEYSDISEVRDLLGMFEEKQPLLELISPEDATEHANVRIGSGGAAGMSNSSLVYRSIRRGGRVVGVIGVIGPRRMDYSRVISTIDQLADGIDDLLNDAGEPFPDEIDK